MSTNPLDVRFHIAGKHVEQPKIPVVSIREVEVWRLLAYGHNTKEIAELMGVSVKTVDQFRSRLYSKIKARNVADATRLAVAHRIITVDLVP